MKITIDDRISLLHSLSFATAYSNFLAALLNGAALFPLDMKTVAHSELTRWVIGQKISVIHLPPTSFREFAESFSANLRLHQLRLIRLSGAPITERDFKLYQTNFPAGTLLNITMGSTELRGICSAVLDQNYIFPPEGAPVGYARPGKQVRILDDLGHEVESGQVGEIAVRSKYADGEYWQPRLGGETLIQRITEDEERVILTGDLGKKLDDGFVIHLGRKDFIVKIRGYRVDLGEIERALLAHPQLIAAAVVAWNRESAEKYLTAYVVARESSTLTVNQLRGFLSEKLADYMIPSGFMFLQSLPLTNGKLDRTALPRPDRKRPNLDTPYAPPRGDVEARLVRIWQAVLDVHPIGIHDNFFDLGGHSLAASRTISRLIQTFQLELPIKALFESPTIAAMATVIAQNQVKLASEAELGQMLREMEAMTEEDAQKVLARETMRRSKGDGHD
jgi:acyl-coenzyme A synthetase/AMP-(fatty) acid ligase